MITTFIPLHPQFAFLFPTLHRADVRAFPHPKVITASEGQHIRSQLVSDYALAFTGRLPAQEVRHV